MARAQGQVDPKKGLSRALCSLGAVQDGCAGCVWHGGVWGARVAVVALVQGQPQAVSPAGLLVSPGVGVHWHPLRLPAGV